MKAQKCRLIFHAMYKEIDFGMFESKAKAKQYAKQCFNKSYSIRPVKQ